MNFHRSWQNVTRKIGTLVTVCILSDYPMFAKICPTMFSVWGSRKKNFKKSKFWNCFYMTTSEIRENFWNFDFHKLNKIIEFQFWDFTLKKFHFPKIWEKNWIPNGTDLIFENLETLLNCIFSRRVTIKSVSICL